MPARQGIALPKNFERASIQASGAVTAEVDIDSARFQHRRRGGVAIKVDGRAERFRFVAMKDLLIKQNLARFLVHTDCKKVVAVDCGRGQPDLPVENDRRGPTLVRDGSFPLDVVRFAPMQRQAEQVGLSRGRRAPVAPRPAKIGPIVPREGGQATKRQEQNAGKCAHIASTLHNPFKKCTPNASIRPSRLHHWRILREFGGIVRILCFSLAESWFLCGLIRQARLKRSLPQSQPCGLGGVRLALQQWLRLWTPMPRSCSALNTETW